MSYNPTPTKTTHYNVQIRIQEVAVTPGEARTIIEPVSITITATTMKQAIQKAKYLLNVEALTLGEAE